MSLPSIPEYTRHGYLIIWFKYEGCQQILYQFSRQRHEIKG